MHRNKPKPDPYRVGVLDPLLTANPAKCPLPLCIKLFALYIRYLTGYCFIAGPLDKGSWALISACLGRVSLYITPCNCCQLVVAFIHVTTSVLLFFLRLRVIVSLERAPVARVG